MRESKTRFVDQTMTYRQKSADKQSKLLIYNSEVTQLQVQRNLIDL